MANTTPSKLRIALVDDHDPFRAAIRQLLELRGYETSDFNSVPSFIEAEALKRTDCLILDLAMPDIDGFALKECIEQTNYRIPVIFCTGTEMDEKTKAALSADGTIVLQKPVQAEILIAAIESSCARK